INLGQAGNYAVFGLGSNTGVTTDTVLGNTAQIYGNVAIGAGTSTATGSMGVADFKKGFIKGNVFVDGSFTGSPGYAQWQLDTNFGVSGTIDGNAGNHCTNLNQNCASNPTNPTQGATNLSQAVQD